MNAQWVRTILSLLVVLLISTTLHAATRYSVVAAAARVQALTGPELLRQICGRGDVEACTHLSGLSLSAGCSEDGGAWQMAVRASFVPYVYLGEPAERLLTHEMTHVRDIHASIEEYVSELAVRRFDTESDCERARLAAGDAFADEFQRFAAESQRERH